MYAIVTAGGIPNPEDPLYSFLKGDAKALVDVAGKPMIQWVLDALNEARQIEEIILVGLSAKSGLVSAKPIHYVTNQGRMLANLVAGINKALALNGKTEYVAMVSSDIPALKGEMVDWLISRCMETKDDLYYGVCPREVMETRFPDSRRTYTHLKDIDLCGADINITHVRMATEHLDLWEKLIGNRKSPMRQAAIVGMGLIWKLMVTHSLTLDMAVADISRRLNIKGRAIVWEHAEPCMDVDKPHQLEILRADLAKQQAREKRAASAVAKKAEIEKTAAPKLAAKKTAPKVKPAAKKAAPKVTARKTTSKPKPAARKKTK